MHCPDPNDIGHDAKPVGLSFDGCVHKKESYTKVQLLGHKVRFTHFMDILIRRVVLNTIFFLFTGRKIL